MQESKGARETLSSHGSTVRYHSLEALARRAGADLARLPFTVKILLENVARHQARGFATEDGLFAFARWDPRAASACEIPFLPARVVLQDFTGVPAVVDLAAMRVGGDAARRRSRPASTRSCPPISSSTTPCRSTLRLDGRLRAPTSSSSTSATASAMRCCAGARRRSATSASFRPGRASCTR